MQQAQTVEVIAQAIMPLFKVVPTSRIHWKTSIRNFTREDVMNMAASLRTHGQIHSIITQPADQEGRFEGVIGHLRYVGAKHAHLPTVLIRIHKFSSQAEVLEWQLVENLHRKSMSALEKAAAYGKLAQHRKKQFSEENVIQGISSSIEALTGTKPALQTVRNYLEIDRRIGKEARSVSARTEQEKASSVKISHLQQISRIEDQNKQAELLLNTAQKQWTVTRLKREVDRALGAGKPKPFKPQLFNVWNFGVLDRQFGTYGYLGQTPGQIVQNLLYYYTSEGNLIVDPMAGGGTTVDVCKLMKRRYLAYDLHPSRADIKQNDIRKGYPEEAKDSDLIFLDPPYYNAIHRDKPFFNDLNEFYGFITTLARHSFQTIKKEGHVALLMLSKDNKSKTALSLNCGKIFLSAGFRCVEAISCPLTTQSADSREVERAKKNHRMLGRNRDLYVFRKVSTPSTVATGLKILCPRC